ncbi:hypothetical protein AURDEDRAFT_163348 [Auricularia subglabra TFB-10046 SS5]|nr:hypothetical protein AURDEDRAFT_163348 [Auricularia subglabra TFB-10046 SS5]
MTLETIQTIKRQSYLSQLLHRDGDKAKLQDADSTIKSAFDGLMVDLRLRTHTHALDLSATLEDLLARQSFQLQEPPTVVANPAPWLPPSPHLHFGRTKELLATVTAVAGQHAGHVAILGGPGMGKTTLAVAVLHHPSVLECFGSGAFGIVHTEAKTTQKQLLAALQGNRSLLILDNFESAWEPRGQRNAAENLLWLLTSSENVSIIVTLRGTERPDGVKWSRPFLPPLATLSDAAARQTFLAITDVSDTDAALDNVLHHLDNIPLAVVLMANLAQAEPLEALLRRWTELETAMLHCGGKPDRTSSLDKSIELSLHSPRMRASPGAHRLLSVLALLPSGVSDIDIRLWDIESSAQLLSVLGKTSLALYNGESRIHVLAPVRSYMISHYPPSEGEALPIYGHYFGLADLVLQVPAHSMDRDAFSLVASEMANIDAVVRFAFKHSRQGLTRAIQAVISLSTMHVSTGIGSAPELLPLASSMARDAGLDDLHADLLLKWARVSAFSPVPGDPNSLARSALEIYQRTGNAPGALRAGIFLIASHPHKVALSEAQRLFAIAEAQGDGQSMAHCAQELAALLSDEGNFLDAIASHRRVIALARAAAGAEAGDTRLVGNSMFLIAGCFEQLGRLEDATGMYKEALSTYEAQGFINGVIRVHLQLAERFRGQGALRAAIDHAERALSVKGAESFHHYPENLMVVAGAHALAGNFDAARSAIDRVYQLGLTHDLSPSSHCRILYTQAVVAQLSGDLTEARTLLSAALIVARREHPTKHPAYMRHVEANLVEALGEVEADDGNKEKAVTLAITGSALHRTSAASVEPVHCLVLLAEAVDDSTAQSIIDAVLPALQRIGSVYGIAKSLVCSATIAQH